MKYLRTFLLLWLACASVWAQQPSILVRPAPPLRLPGGNQPEANIYDAIDCNSPLHWDDKGNLYAFASVAHPFRATGSGLYGLRTTPSVKVNIKPRAGQTLVGGYWLEATYRDNDGTLYGWYHNERSAGCSDPHLTMPYIGMMYSRDEGLNWQDLGHIMSAPQSETDCNTGNYYFANGVGDFTVLLDPQKQFFYIHFGAYYNDITQQGICVARMPYANRMNPTNAVRKSYKGQWSEPGLNGRVTPFFRTLKDWHSETPDSLWGPSVHYNTYLQTYVMVLNRAVSDTWTQEGVYYSFNPIPAQPDKWTTPLRLPIDPQGRAYPQVVGWQFGETDKWLGKVGRLFLLGESNYELVFQKPNEGTAQFALPMAAPARKVSAARTSMPRRR
jgi:hypothetical protein